MPLRHPTRTLRVGEFTVRVHYVHEWIAQRLITDGGYEAAEIATMCALLRPGDTVLDVGANIGVHSMHLSRAVGPTGIVHAFEPDPANVKLLRRNLERNGCANVVVHPYGLAAEGGAHTLFLCRGNKGLQSLVRMEHSTSEITIDLRRAADVLSGVAPRAMKLDVEGAEALVLDGFDEWPATVVFEFVPAQLRAFGQDPRSFIQRFIDRGYVVSLLGEHADDTPLDPSAVTALADATGADYNPVARRAATAGSTGRVAAPSAR
jgi:FkbM family methyltransferase